MRHSVRNGASGTTLVELVVAMSITTVVVMGSMTIMSTSRIAADRCTLSVVLASQAINICDRIAADLKDAQSNIINNGTSLSNSSNTITFTKCGGWGITGTNNGINTYGVLSGSTINYQLIPGTKIIQRTETPVSGPVQIEDLTDSAIEATTLPPTAATGGLIFQSLTPNVWTIQVSLQRPEPDQNSSYLQMLLPANHTLYTDSYTTSVALKL